MRTTEGSKLHENMMLLARQYLEKQGYEVVLRSRVNSGGLLDVLGIKGKERVGIECQVLPSYAIIADKVIRYKPYLNKLIVAIPQNIKYRLMPEGIELIKLPIDKPKTPGKKISLMINDELEESFRKELAKRKGGYYRKGDFQEAVSEALTLWIKTTIEKEGTETV